MKKNIRKGLIAVFLIIFLVSGGMVIKKVMEYKAGEKTYDDVAELAGLQTLENTQETDTETADDEEKISSETDSEKEEASEKKEEKKTNPLPKVSVDNLANLNLDALQKINKDVMGWIIIPGADISYPLLDGDDNSYYLNRTWDKQWNTMGSIFLEAECSNKLSEFNTIIYGHNMRNTTMFSNLKKYVKKSFWSGAPYVYIATEDGVRRYDIFAAYEVSVEGHAFWINIEDEQLKQKFIDKSLEMSEIKTDIVPVSSDHILTLSTCTGNGHEKRMIVQAVLAAGE